MVGNAFFIFDIYFRSLKFKLKGYLTHVRASDSNPFKNKYTKTYDVICHHKTSYDGKLCHLPHLGVSTVLYSLFYKRKIQGPRSTKAKHNNKGKKYENKIFD